MAVSFALVFLLVALVASCALGVGTAYLVVRKTKRPILWVLTPVFAALWFLVGAAPLSMYTWASLAAPLPPPRPPVPGPVQVAPAAEVPEIP